MNQIVAFGGGGFSMETSPLIDEFVLSRARKQPARVCFLPTASGDAAAYVAMFYRAFAGKCVATDLTVEGELPRQPTQDSEIEAFLLAQDVVYVGGGNTAQMLERWRIHGIDRALIAAWNAGVVLAGLSAGMNCWFADSVTDSFGPLAPLRDGLAILPFSACPHYDSEVDRRPRYHALIAEGMQPGYAAEDGVALHFVGTELREAVSSRPDAYAYWVDRDGEAPLAVRYLGE